MKSEDPSLHRLLALVLHEPHVVERCRTRRSDLKRPSNVLHEEHKVQFVGRARLEFGHQVEVEVSGFVRLGMHQQASTANVGGQFK